MTGATAAVYAFERDAEVKLLLGCTREEAEVALAEHRTEHQAALLVWRELLPREKRKLAR